MVGPRIGRRCLFVFAMASAAFAPRLFGQSVLFEYAGPSSTNPIDFGVLVGDWDGDGVPDVAIRASYDDTVAPDAGAVEVRSGKNGSLLQTFYGAKKEDYFGIPVAMPDLDGDGKPELLVLDYYSDLAGPNFGSAFLFAGGSGTQLWRVDGTRLLGIGGGPVNDLDADGVPDVFVTEVGALHVCSGASGTELFAISGPPSFDFGYSSADLGDLNGDGVDDFIVGAPDANGAGMHRGRATIYSGSDQSVLQSFFGQDDFDHLGDACARIGDVDGDGLRDFAIVDRHQNYLAGNDPAVVRIHSAATFAVLGTIQAGGGSYLFSRIDATGDANGDGVEDFALLFGASPNSKAMWATTLFSGKTLTRLYSFEHLEPDGFVVGDAGDFDGDGFRDLLAASPFDAGGRFRIYSGNDLWLDASDHVGRKNATLTLSTGEEPTGNLTVLAIVGVDGTPAFQLVDGLGQFDATQRRVVTGTVPAGLSGHSLDLQAFALDPSGHVVDSAVETIDFN
jgi:hypothetical protein